MKGDRRPIGVFDSGLGGLSVLSEIHRLLPSENLLYVGDSAHAPYGDKSSEFVRNRTIEIAEFFIEQDVKAMVIACNTATVETIHLLREIISIPIIGLEPAIKPACNISNSAVIGVLATQRTIDSKAFHSLIERYADNTKVIPTACHGLVEQVESLQLNNKKTELLLTQYIQPLLTKGADTIILGCTHYPFLINEIRKIVGDKIEILETSKPVALQLKRLLEAHDVASKHSHKTGSSSKITFYNSQTTNKMTTSMQKLWHLLMCKAEKTETEDKIIKAIEVLPLPR